jgi:hypothetical protein
MTCDAGPAAGPADKRSGKRDESARERSSSAYKTSLAERVER